MPQEGGTLSPGGKGAQEDRAGQRRKRETRGLEGFFSGGAPPTEGKGGHRCLPHASMPLAVLKLDDT